MTRRALLFVGVGALGFVVQMTMLMLLTAGHWPLPLATALAVEAAVLANFFGHERWTWGDRAATGGERSRRLIKFHLGNGLTSLIGNVLLTIALVRAFDIHPIAANIMAVITLAVANFITADKWVFVRPLALTGAVLLVASSPAAAAQPTAAALAAWNAHVAEVERTFDAEPRVAPLAEPVGRRIGIADGSIHEWRGSIVVHGTTVEQVVNRLIDPCALPPQEDVVKVRLLERDGDRLKVYMRLVRKMIVTATYDTEHAVTYTRRSPTDAVSRSISTKIAEDGGDDRGFLWRLNAYWHYRQVGSDVQIDLLSLSLSRDVPWVLKPIAGPLIERVGRESMNRTLRSVYTATDRSSGHEAPVTPDPACSAPQVTANFAGR